MQRLILNTIFTRGVSTFLNFLVALLIARHTGPAIKGEVTLLVTTIWFLVFFSNILGGQALVYLLPRNKLELVVVPGYLWSLFITALSYFILRYTHLLNAIHIPSIVVLGFLSSVTSIHQTVLLAQKKISKANMLQLVPLSIQVAGILVCFYAFKINDAYAYIYSSLAAFTIGAVVSFFMVRKSIMFSYFLSDFTFTDLKVSLRYGFLYHFVEVFQLLNLRYYFYQLGIQQGSRYLGVYSIGISILEAVWLIPRSINTVHYVSTSNSSETDKEKLRTVQLLKISTVICFIALLLIWAAPPGVYTSVFGPGFKDVKHSMRFLAPGILIYSPFFIVSSFYLGIGKYSKLIIAGASGFLSLVFFSWVLIPKYVMSGAGLAATLSFTIATGILLTGFIREMKLPLKVFLINSSDLNTVTQWLKPANKLNG
ncbi:MAG TPA: polysaccharide biosynthesis C-terminal domain-containing protein [Chitinophagales bacterium]|nr:polysaccharide biosynthesis C-terminal domain-containing protein [Chitinophagales bacterium]